MNEIGMTPELRSPSLNECWLLERLAIIKWIDGRCPCACTACTEFRDELDKIRIMETLLR
jgi:hypothetical protein